MQPFEHEKSADAKSIWQRQNPSTGKPLQIQQSAAYNDTALLEAYSGALNDRTPVILVHGLHGNRTGIIAPDTADNPNQNYFKNLILHLNNGTDYNNRFKTYKFHWVSDKWTTRQIALALLDRIDERSEFANKQIIIITHSTGALIARQYMTLRTLSGNDPRFTNRPAGERVIKVITLAGPHHGTYAANGTARVGNSIYYGGGLGRWALYKLSDKLYWDVMNGCGACVSNLQQPNRGSLLWDNFDGRWNNNLPYTTNVNEMNLEPIPPTYNYKIIAYWGEVSTSDTAWRLLLGAAASTNKLVKFFSSSYTYGVGTDTEAALAAYLIQTIKNGSLSISTPQNDGLVPVESGRFDSSSGLMGSVHCGGYNHRQLLDGSWSKQCDNHKYLLDSVRDDVLGTPSTSSALLLATQRTGLGYQNYGSAGSAKPGTAMPLVAIQTTSDVELGNAGDTALQVTSLSLTGANPNQFSIVSAPSTPFTIPAKSAVTVIVAFNPTSTGMQTANLQALNNSSNSVVTVLLDGFGFPSSCDVTFSPENRYMPVQGGSGSFTIPNISCPWSIVTNDNWIHPTAIGNTINFTVDANTTGGTRGGQINVLIYDRVYSFDIQQGSSSSGCTLNLSGNTQNVPSGGGSGGFNVLTPDTCGWGFQSGSPWITVNNQGLRQGSGSISFTVAPSTASSLRVGTIIVEGQDSTQVFTVTQDAGSGSCTYLLSTTEQILPASGGQNSFTINTGSNCPWQVSSPDRWITLNSTNNGTGSRTISYTAAANSLTGTRLGSIVVQGSGSTQLLTVNENGQPVVYPSISLPMTNFQMGDALVGSTIYQGVVINNTGPGYLLLGSVYRLSGSTDFDVLPYGQNQSIAPSGSKSVTIKLTPSSTGGRSATFSISSNDPNQPVVNFTVSGNGVTQITGGIDFIWSNKSTIPVSGLAYAGSATIANNIYVFGGEGHPYIENYRFDPTATTNSWNRIADTPYGQDQGGADVINGKIYVVGSVNGNFLQIYDPGSNSWIVKAGPQTRKGMSVAAVNGKLYVIGGTDGGNGAVTLVQEYDPATDTWTTKTSMPTPRAYAAVAVVNNLIYVLGGQGSGGSRSGATEVFDPVANSWSTRQSDPTLRARASAVALNNKIYVIGGSLGGPDTIDVVEEHNPSLSGSFGTWFQRNHILTARASLATGTVNGKVYVIGGTSNNGGSVTTVEEGVLAASPKINLPVTTFNCGDVPLGNFCDKRIEVQNEGNAQLVISNWGRNSGSSDFNIFRSYGTVEAGQSVGLVVRFAPTSTGSKSAGFFLNSNDPNTPNLSFTISGSATPAPSANGTWQVVNSIPLADSYGGPTRITISNSKAYVVRSIGGSGVALTMIDLSSNTLIGSIPISAYPNAEPGYVAVAGNRAYLALNSGSDGKLGVLNTDNNSVLAYVPVGPAPFGVGFVTNKVYVSNEVFWSNGDPATVKVVDAGTNTVTNSITVGRGPSQVATDSISGRVYVANNCSTGPNCAEGDVANPLKSLSVIDSATDTVAATVPLPYFPNSVALAANRAYVCTGPSIEVIDLSSNSVMASIPVLDNSYAVAASPDYVFVLSSSKVTLIKVATNSILGTVNINSPSGIAVDPSTNLVYVTRASDRTISVLRFIAPGFAVSTSAQSLAANAGGNTTFTSTVTSIDGFSGAINLSCEGLPTGATCQFTQNPVTVPANGSVSTTLTVVVPAGTVPGSYSLRVVGSGSVSLGGATSKDGTVTVLDTTTTTDFQNVSLTVPSCDFLLSSPSVSVGSGANTGRIDVEGTSGCPWTANSNASWITVSSGGSGTGNGTVNYSIAANPNSQSRTGSLTIAGQPLPITQAGITCSFSLTTSTATVPSSAATGSFSFSAAASDCQWAASSNVNWISIASPTSGSGPGTVSYSVSANTGPTRTGTITIGSQAFTINQTAGCAFTLTSASQSFGAVGGTGSLGVTCESGCTWQATSNASWITITGGGSGNGSGTVNYKVDANVLTISRSSTLTVAGQTFTIDQSPASSVQFSSSIYTVTKGDPNNPRVNITVPRTGDTSGAASVSFATIDDAGLQNCNVFNGTASPRCDYENTQGTMNFAAGETSKSFSVAIVADSYAKGNLTFRVALSNPTGATLGSPSIAPVTILDNPSVDGPNNPIDNTNFFVRQQYLDFLGREPDPPGFAGWTSTINNCSGDTTQCDRIHVSQLFFQSAEFQDRGYFVYRFYPVAFGRKPDYGEFVPDLASVSGFLDANQLEAAKVAFIASFMARPAFVGTYNSLNNTQYVDTLLNTAGVTLSSRQAMIDGLNNSTTTRGQVLRQIVESTEVSTKYNHQAYAVMEYFGYLRRQPDGFYLQWIQVLDSTNDPRGMVTGFATSAEYRQRFGP